MSSPPVPYARQANFTDFESTHPDDPKPGVDLDDEFNTLLISVNKTISRLNEIQRNDGRLANASVYIETLSSAVLTLLAAAGMNPRGAWVTATAYAVKDVVTISGSTYFCATAHTSGVFRTDLAANKWVLIAGGSYEFNVTNYGAVCDGVTDDYAAFSAAIAAASAIGGTLVVPGTMKIGTNINVPYNVALKFPYGGALKPAAGITITIDGVVNAGPFTVFLVNGNGTVDFNTNDYQREFVAEWWDWPRNDNTKDAVPVLDKIINGIRDYTTLKFVSQTGLYTKQAWLIKGRVGLKIIAQGGDVEETPQFTFQEVGGAFTTPKFSSYSSLASTIVFEACGHCTLQGFWIKNAQINVGVEVCGFGPRISTNNYILNNRITLNWSPAGVDDWTGIQIAVSGEQNNEFMYIRGNQIEGNAQKGRGIFTGGGSNNHGHTIERNNILGCNKGITSGWAGYRASWNSFTNCNIDFDFTHSAYPNLFEFNDSEGSRQHVVCGSAGGESSTTIRAERLAGLGAAGYAWFDLGPGACGPITIEGCDYQNTGNNGSYLYGVPYSGGFTGSSLALCGNQYANLTGLGFPNANFFHRTGSSTPSVQFPISIRGEMASGGWDNIASAYIDSAVVGGGAITATTPFMSVASPATLTTINLSTGMSYAGALNAQGVIAVTIRSSGGNLTVNAGGNIGRAGVIANGQANTFWYLPNANLWFW